MAANALDEPSIIQWLEKRRRITENLEQATLFNESQRWLEERTAFSFYTSSNPHTCEHCKQVTIDLADEGGENRAQLPYGLPESVQAARGGCALYQAFVDLVFDSLRRKPKSEWPADDALSFWIQYYPEALPSDAARLNLTVVSSPDARTKKTLGGDGGFTVWALEGIYFCRPSHTALIVERRGGFHC
jgi:hypothetical protein